MLINYTRGNDTERFCRNVLEIKDLLYTNLNRTITIDRNTLARTIRWELFLSQLP